MISRKLHHKGSRLTSKHFGFLEHDAGNDDGSHSDKVGGSSYPCGAAENSASDHRDKRDFCAAGDKGSRHDRHAAIPLIFNGSGCHNAGDTAASADQHRNKGLAGQPELSEHTVKHESDAGHISAGFQESKEQE